MNNVTRLEREIAKALGVTPNMLDVLRRINRGDDISGNNSGTALEDRGYLTSQGWEYDEHHRPHGAIASLLMQAASSWHVPERWGFE